MEHRIRTPKNEIDDLVAALCIIVVLPSPLSSVMLSHVTLPLCIGLSIEQTTNDGCGKNAKTDTHDS
jgi:hypothetical protein